MTEAILMKLAQDSPWILLCGFLLHRLFQKEGALLNAYREGAQYAEQMLKGMEHMREALIDLREEVRRK